MNNIIPSEIFESGYNCAETILKAYNDEFKTEIPLSVASGLGGGLAVGSVCGAINAATIVIGYELVKNPPDTEKIIRSCVENFMNSLTEKYSSCDCKCIKVDRETCRQIIDYTYDKLKETLKEEMSK